MLRTRSWTTALAALSVTGALVAAGCGGGGDDQGFRKDGSKIDGDPGTALPAALASTKSTLKVRKPGEPLPEQKNIIGVSSDLATKPKVPAAVGKAPTELQGSDVVVGTGATAEDGDTVSVQYVGVLFNGGKQFDASWDRKQPFSFTLGQGSVIQGWDQGVPGMKVGGRRVLVIPPDLAYGATGSQPTIPANAPLVFVVDLKKVTKAK
jgi:FKBP-type peptidyl-prolyl cis-trans isomerase